MTRSNRRATLALALIATLVAAWLAPSETPEVPISAPPVRMSERASESSSPVRGPSLLRIKPRINWGDPDDLTFAMARWGTVKPVPKATPQPQPTAESPQAPPLPFRYLGRYESGGEGGVFLSFKDRTLIVREGDLIDEQYRVSRVGADMVEVEYLPLSQTQTINIASGG